MDGSDHAESGLGRWEGLEGRWDKWLGRTCLALMVAGGIVFGVEASEHHGDSGVMAVDGAVEVAVILGADHFLRNSGKKLERGRMLRNDSRG